MPGLPRLPITDRGIDARGVGFVSLLHRDTQPLSLQRLADPANIFINIIEAVSKFHLQGIYLGDLCGVSFVLDGTGRVLLSALLGSYDYSARGTSLIPPRETLFYIAPEQRAVASPTATCDIYALGIMGYRLVTGRFPQGNKPERFLDQNLIENALAPSELVQNCPPWLDRVIAKCVETDVSSRYQSCEAMLADIRAENDGETEASAKWLHRNKTVHFNMSGLGVSLDRSVARLASRPTRIFVLLSLFLLAIVAAVVSGSRDSSEMEDLESLKVSSGSSGERRLQIMKQILVSDDPVSIYVIGSLYLQQDDKQNKQETGEALFKYFERRNKLYLASALRWLLQLPNDQLPSKEQLRLILEICDDRYAAAKRLQKLNQLHTQDREKASVFLTAVALGKEIDAISNTLKQWLQEIGEEGSSVFYTPVALTLSSAHLRAIFSAQVPSLVAELLPEETVKLLELQSGGDSQLIMHLAARAKIENLYPPFHELIVDQIMAVAGRQEKELTNVYVRALTGKIGSGDFTRLSPCSDDKQSVALLSLYILSSDNSLSEQFLKAIRLCIPHDPLSSELLTGQLQTASPLLTALIVIALGSRTDYAELDRALSAIIPAPTRDSILGVIFSYGEPQLIGLTLERAGGALSSQYLLSLAKHPNSEVRSRVVAILVRRNDISIEQPLAELMADEQDRSVLVQYRAGLAGSNQ